MSDIKIKVQAFGRFLSNMVMPNIGAFIAWGFITALFIETGWTPVAAIGGFGEYAGKGIVGPMLKFLLPILIGYQGGKLVHKDRGAVVGAISTIGVIVGTDIPMFLGAMIAGPLGGLAIKTFDKAVEGKIKSGFEMLVNNFSAGIIGMILALLTFFIIGPVVEFLTQAMAAGVKVLVDKSLLPLTSILVEPAKILFLNNAINHGIFTPMGTLQAGELGKSVFYLIEANPGPGLGVLLAYMIFGKGSAKQTAGGAAIIHFFGGIHEIYFPYVLMNPRLLLAVIAGGMTGVFTLTTLGGGLVSPSSPGSIIAVMAVTPSGGFMPNLAAVAAGCVVSFIVASIFVKAMPEDAGDLDEMTRKMKEMKAQSKGMGTTNSLANLRTVYVACDAGMGSSATGASMLRKKVQEAGLPFEVVNLAINDLPLDTQFVITHKDLTPRAQQRLPNAQHLSLTNFLDKNFYDQVVEMLKEIKGSSATAAQPAPVKKEEKQKFTFSSQQVYLNQKAADKETAIRFVGQALVDNGFVKADYIEAMLERERDTSTYLGMGIAIPHGTIAAKNAVLKTGIVFAQYREGVNFSDEEKAYLVIGIAAQNNEHIGVIASLTNALDDEEVLEKLKTTDDVEFILKTLNN